MTEEEKTILLTRHDGLLQRQEGRIKDVSQMAQRSGRRWDMIVEKAIAAIAGALVGFILLKLGLG